jgi:predicted phage tail protein
MAGYFNIAYSQAGSPVGFGEYTIAYGRPAAPPAAPNGLTAGGATSSTIKLTWSDNASNESGFKIERCTGVGCTNFAQIATVGSNVTTYTNSGLAASTAYSYRVRAYNSGGDSAYSNVVSATTTAQPAPPTAPTGLTANAISKTQINLSWTDSADNEDGFKIERCTGATCTKFAKIATVGANITAYSNTGLRKGTTYRYRVAAYNAGGTSGYSNIVAATTPR